MNTLNPCHLSNTQATMVMSCIAMLREQVGTQSQHDETLGICFNLGEIVDGLCFGSESWFNSYTLTAECSATWPGCRSPGEVTSFPIRRTQGFRMWEGPNLEARLSLLDHMYKMASDIVSAS